MVPKMISVIRQLANVNVKLDILLRHVMNVTKDILDSLIVKEQLPKYVCSWYEILSINVPFSLNVL